MPLPAAARPPFQRGPVAKELGQIGCWFRVTRLPDRGSGVCPAPAFLKFAVTVSSSEASRSKVTVTSKFIVGRPQAARPRLPLQPAKYQAPLRFISTFLGSSFHGRGLAFWRRGLPSGQAVLPSHSRWVMSFSAFWVPLAVPADPSADLTVSFLED